MIDDWNSSSGSLIWQVANFMKFKHPPSYYFVCTSKLYKKIYFNYDLYCGKMNSTKLTDFCRIKIIVNDTFNFGINNDYQIVLKEEYDSGNIEHLWIHGEYSYI